MQILQRPKAMRLEKRTGIKLHMGVDVLGLPHTIMLTTADVTDRNGAVDMVDYYCDVARNLSMLKKILADGVILGKSLQIL